MTFERLAVTPEQITELTWGRKLGDYSEAHVTAAKRNLPRDCLGALADAVNAAGQITHPGAHSWSHELTIYRDGGIVWQGPLVQPEQNEIDLILDKISRSGYESLSKEEKQKLFKASQQ